MALYLPAPSHRPARPCLADSILPFPPHCPLTPMGNCFPPRACGYSALRLFSCISDGDAFSVPLTMDSLRPRRVRLGPSPVGMCFLCRPLGLRPRPRAKPSHSRWISSRVLQQPRRNSNVRRVSVLIVILYRAPSRCPRLCMPYRRTDWLETDSTSFPQALPCCVCCCCDTGNSISNRQLDHHRA